MHHRFLGAASVITLSATLFLSGAALSQTSQRQNVQNQLSEHKIDIANFDALSNSQVSQIQLILNSTEGSNTQKQALVDALLSEKAPCEGNPQLALQVQNQLREHGITIQNFDNITGSELVVVKTILDAPVSDSEKKTHIERVFADEEVMQGGNYLRTDAEQCVKMVGADIDVNDLTPDQMLRVQLIANSTESESAKRAMMEELAK